MRKEVPGRASFCVSEDLPLLPGHFFQAWDNAKCGRASCPMRTEVHKVKPGAIKRQGSQNDLTSPKISAKLRSCDEIDQQLGGSNDPVRNRISLTNLIPELMEMLDEEKTTLSPPIRLQLSNSTFLGLCADFL